MTPYTLPIKHSDTQVLELIKRAQTIQRPLMLTVDGDPEPAVVVLKKDAYEQTERQRYHLYHLRLTHLQQWLEWTEAYMDDAVIRQKCVTIWQNSLAPLWEVTPETVRGFCASLMLSVKCLDPDQLSLTQIATLRYSLELLRDSEPGEPAIQKAYQMLITSDLPPILSFSDSVIQSYIDEL